MTQPNWSVWEEMKEKFFLIDTEKAKANWEAWKEALEKIPESNRHAEQLQPTKEMLDWLDKHGGKR